MPVVVTLKIWHTAIHGNRSQDKRECEKEMMYLAILSVARYRNNQKAEGPGFIVCRTLKMIALDPVTTVNADDERR